MNPARPVRGQDACRQELAAWLEAPAQWPMSVEIHTVTGDLVAAMTGRLAAAVGAIYEVLADEGSLQLAVPELVDDDEIDGARSARFTRRDLPVRIVLIVTTAATWTPLTRAARGIGSRHLSRPPWWDWALPR